MQKIMAVTIRARHSKVAAFGLVFAFGMLVGLNGCDGDGNRWP